MKQLFSSALLAVMFTASPAFAFIDINLQMQLGNPSGATADTNNHNHYLVQRTVQALDYSDNLGSPVWASWDLTAGDVGSATRSTVYFTDTNLPPNFYRVTTTDYNGVGTNNFNRGHLCPSEDRTDTTANNNLVFFMSNIMPQSAQNNQGVWANLESDCRTLASAGNELLITCGPSGFSSRTIPSGKAYIGSNVWKIIVVVPLGSGTALSRLNATNRVIAVSIPNVTNGLSSDWRQYVTTPKRIEQDTGFTFFTAVSPTIANIFRNEQDGQPVFSSIVKTTNNLFRFTVSGWTATNYVVQGNTNLISTNWIPLLTNAAPFTFTQSNANTFSQRFYRAKIWP